MYYESTSIYQPNGAVVTSDNTISKVDSSLKELTGNIDRRRSSCSKTKALEEIRRDNEVIFV